MLPSAHSGSHRHWLRSDRASPHGARHHRCSSSTKTKTERSKNCKMTCIFLKMAERFITPVQNPARFRHSPQPWQLLAQSVAKNSVSLPCYSPEIHSRWCFLLHLNAALASPPLQTASSNTPVLTGAPGISTSLPTLPPVYRVFSWLPSTLMCTSSHRFATFHYEP